MFCRLICILYVLTFAIIILLFISNNLILVLRSLREQRINRDNGTERRRQTVFVVHGSAPMNISRPVGKWWRRQGSRWGDEAEMDNNLELSSHLSWTCHLPDVGKQLQRDNDLNRVMSKMILRIWFSLKQRINFFHPPEKWLCYVNKTEQMGKCLFFQCEPFIKYMSVVYFNVIVHRCFFYCDKNSKTRQGVLQP